MKATAISCLMERERDLRIDWGDGSNSDFHYFWLRDNCRCPACLHPQTWERTLDTYAIDPDIQPLEMEIQAGALRLCWPDGHESIFEAAWLQDHAYSGACRKDATTRFWGLDILEDMPTIEAVDILETEEGLRRFLELQAELGFVIVKNLTCEEGMVERLAERVDFLRRTNYGVDFSVESKPDPNNVAYTALELKAHTDLCDLEQPPGFQFLHCIVNEASGGESLLVDGFAVAEELRRRDPASWRLLTETALPFRFVDKDYDLRWKTPTIRLGPDGEYQEVRYHVALTDPLDVPYERMEAVYAALRAFTAVLRDPAFEIRFRLDAGDVMAFHNRRVLHGRAAFDPNSGRRKLKGCYVNSDEAWSKLRVLNGLNHI
ncbi:TauD/TfdA family dioxygenase [Aestuariispira ectoiniformans]|uniref:TauD/TfdA family dioxygenase n=1 Tax=Aestuariispira ectoiniformans TaxID=2775080 RepID=UPI00223B3999|nr:TauD/TfdA family dioxygenase [Aestuariispira ectoiniformans]